MAMRRLLRNFLFSALLLALGTVLSQPARAQSEGGGGLAGAGASAGEVSDLGVLSPGDVPDASMVSGPSGLSSFPEGAKQALKAAAEHGAGEVSPEEVAEWKKLVGQGGPTAEQMQRLCAGIAAKHLTVDSVEKLVGSLGLSGAPAEELKNCAQTKRAGMGGERAVANTSLPGQASPAPGGLSSIESEFRNLTFPAHQVVSPSPIDLEQFGYSLFASPVSTFAPVTDVPVGPDYILGSGDTLNVLLWGRVNDTLHLHVERDGTILTPQLGPIVVAGLTFEMAKKLLEGRMGQITGLKVDVTMGQIRTIQIFVIGKVNHPGLYTVSALSHVSNVLVAAGGVSKIGSMRAIELRRGNQVVARVDLYNLLLNGNTASDLRVDQGDVIFVPVIGPVVGVTGNVKEPAIYEMAGRENLETVLKMAGGVGAFSYSQRIQIERIDDHQRRIALDVDLAKIRGTHFQVHDGDLLKVFTVLPEQRNVITLKGNVHRPGVYQWYPGMKVADLVGHGEGVADRTYFGYALVRRIEGPEHHVRFLPVDLGAALAHPENANLNFALQTRDELAVYSDDDLTDLPKVAITGAVRKPGQYPLSAGMRVSDLIYEAGGLQEGAYRKNAELVRTKVVNGSSAQYVYEDVDLNKALGGDDSANPELARGDKIFVQQASNWHQPWTVLIRGEVARPGPYVIREGERLDSVLQRSGGIRPYGYLPATVFIRKSVKEMEQKRIDESRQRLQTEVAQLSLMPTQAESTTSKDSLAAVQHILAETQAQQAVGRVVLHLKSVTTLPASRDDIVLENDDEIDIPRLPAAVAVLGQVYNPGAIVYEPGHVVGEYLQKAGGPTQWADADHVFVIRANGDVITDQSLHYGNGALFPLLPAISGGLNGVQLGRGDTIYVPEKMLYTDNLKIASQVAQIVANSVMSMAVLGILGSTL